MFKFPPTTHFVMQYDDTVTQNGPVTPDGPQLCQALLSTCEADNARLSKIFGDINIPQVTVTVDDGGGGSNDSHNITRCGSSGFSGDPDYLRNTFIAELAEIYMAAQNKQWNPGDSKGEALSRVLAGLFYPGGQQPGFTAHLWIDNPPDHVAPTPPFEGLQDWVNNVFSGDATARGDNAAGSIGCGVAFINYLHYQLGFTFRKIVNTSGTTLADVYKGLTGAQDAFGPFAAVVRKRFPQGIPSGLNANDKTPNSDSFFPLPSDKRLSVTEFIVAQTAAGLWTGNLRTEAAAAEAETLKGLVNTWRAASLIP